jgi:hypothetical protein
MVLSDEKKSRELIRQYGQARELAEDRGLRPDECQRWVYPAKEMARRLAIVEVA